MSSLEDRTQIVRTDCPTCKGKGYTVKTTGESFCEPCEGSGMLEKEVPYRYENRGEFSSEEKAELFELPLEQVRDSGHATPSQGVDLNENE